MNLDDEDEANRGLRAVLKRDESDRLVLSDALDWLESRVWVDRGVIAGRRAALEEYERRRVFTIWDVSPWYSPKEPLR